MFLHMIGYLRKFLMCFKLVHRYSNLTKILWAICFSKFHYKVNTSFVITTVNLRRMEIKPILLLFKNWRSNLLIGRLPENLWDRETVVTETNSLICHRIFEDVFAKRSHRWVLLFFAHDDKRSGIPIERARVKNVRIVDEMDVFPEIKKKTF